MILYSPLRYPGGKNRLSAFIAKICIDNNVKGHYIEPYSGGASVALFLLFKGYVERITINDKDRSIFAFWHSVLNNSEHLCNMIENADLTIEEWLKQKELQKHKNNADLLELGFSTFYLNRTNRSGIINGGVIGGITQNGNYLMDCRFNKQDLCDRIRLIAGRAEHISIHNLDAIDLIDLIEDGEGEDVADNIIFYFDPPYFLKADSLYLNHYKYDDHRALSERIKAINNTKWIVSYDNVEDIKILYKEFPQKEFSFKHTAYEVREGKEILVMSENLVQPSIENWNPIFFKSIKEQIKYVKPKVRKKRKNLIT